jgi:subtilisin family serine protease
MARFIVASRMALPRTAASTFGATRAGLRASAETRRDAFQPVAAKLRSSFSVISESLPDAPCQRTWVEGEAADMQKLQKELPPDHIVEPAVPRMPASSHQIVTLQAIAAQGANPLNAGFGATLRVAARGAGGALEGAKALLLLSDLSGRGPGTRVEAQTDPDGNAEFVYNPALWLPSLLTVEPRSSFWDWWQELPQGELALQLPPVEKVGPVGWWHQAVGMTRPASDRGAGIRVGVVDTGVGPHPYLQHVVKAGAIIGGVFQPGDAAGADAMNHGTHVCGIIAARPVDESADYCGIANAVQVVSMRVFDPVLVADQGDVAEAIDRLVFEHDVDIINLSLGGSQPSQIEQDAIRGAAAAGVLCVAAAGNSFGQPLMFPSAYPEAVAVSALGVAGLYPPGTMSAQMLPEQPDRYGPAGLFLAKFSNLGAGITCAAPGVGIVSTVPTLPTTAAPYMAFNGTSMAAPVVTAALASLLSNDLTYRFMPHDTNRTRRASIVLLGSARPLGLDPAYAGVGMVQAWPS